MTGLRDRGNYKVSKLFNAAHVVTVTDIDFTVLRTTKFSLNIFLDCCEHRLWLWTQNFLQEINCDLFNLISRTIAVHYRGHSQHFFNVPNEHVPQVCNLLESWSSCER